MNSCSCGEACGSEVLRFGFCPQPGEAGSTLLHALVSDWERVNLKSLQKYYPHIDMEYELERLKCSGIPIVIEEYGSKYYGDYFAEVFLCWKCNQQSEQLKNFKLKMEQSQMVLVA